MDARRVASQYVCYAAVSLIAISATGPAFVISLVDVRICEFIGNLASRRFADAGARSLLGFFFFE